MKKSLKEHEELLTNDQILTELGDIFSTRLGDPYTNDELEAIFTEGDQRYAQKIPPGYKDASKHGDSTLFVDKRSRFGDLIIWKQIISAAKAQEKSIIFVTDDNKEDWWISARGKTIGARPELIEEFFKETNQNIKLYSTFRFLELAPTYTQAQVSKSALEEVKESRNALRGNALTQDLSTVHKDASFTNITDSINALMDASNGEELDLKYRSINKNRLYNYLIDADEEQNHRILFERRLLERELLVKRLETLHNEQGKNLQSLEEMEDKDLASGAARFIFDKINATRYEIDAVKEKISENVRISKMRQ